MYLYRIQYIIRVVVCFLLRVSSKSRVVRRNTERSTRKIPNFISLLFEWANDDDENDIYIHTSIFSPFCVCVGVWFLCVFGSRLMKINVNALLCLVLLSSTQYSLFEALRRKIYERCVEKHLSDLLFICFVNGI